MHVLRAAFRTLNLSLFVFRKGENDFEWLVAVFAEKLVGRHDDPQSNSANPFYSAWHLIARLEKVKRQMHAELCAPSLQNPQ